LITKGNPKLHVANFSATAVTIQIGQVLGIGHNPNTLLDRMGKYFPESQQRIDAHATVMQTPVESRTPGLGLGAQSEVATVFCEAKDLSNSNKINFTEEDPLSEPPLEGGLKSLNYLRILWIVRG